MPERPGRRGPALALAALLSSAATAPCQAATGTPGRWQDGPAAQVEEAFSAGRLGMALELAEGIEDPLLAAEWRFHVLYHGGDLPGALAAVEEGLAGHPDSPSLLENGARCALTLGDARRARSHAERLAQTAQDPDVLARANFLLGGTELLLEREDRARAGLLRARAVTGLLAALAAGLLFGLARRS